MTALCTITLILSSCQTQFEIPDNAIEDFSISQFAGSLNIRSKSLSAWLDKSKENQIVALKDTRSFDDFILKGISKEKQRQSSQRQESDSDSDSLQINHLAYQLLCTKYNLDPLSYRDESSKKNQLINTLIKIISKAT